MPDSLSDAIKNGNLQPASAFNPNGVTSAQLEKLGENLSGVWDVNKNKRGPDTGFQASMGDSFSFGDFRLGYITAAGWKQEFRKQNEINREFSATRAGLDEIQDFGVQRSLREVAVTGYAATELEYKNTHRLFAKTMFLRQSFDEARITQGTTDAETTDVRRTRLRFFSNQLLMNQFGGEHRFDRLKDFTINWLYTDATANRDEPKTRDYRYDLDARNNNYIFSQRVDSNLISYSDSVDKDRSWRVDGKLPLQLTPSHKLTLSSGFITQTKSRDASSQRFSYFRFGPDASNSGVYSQPSVESILQP